MSMTMIEVKDAQTIPALKDAQAGQTVHLTVSALVVSVSVEPIDVTTYGDTGVLPKIAPGYTTVTLAVQEIT